MSSSSSSIASKLEPYRHASLKDSFDLSSISPKDKPFSSGSKDDDKQQVEALAQELDGLENLFYADRRFKLLVVLQGIDTSGKDGTLRGVFSRMSPLGVQTAAWKAPSDEEKAHDFLWRIHAKVPAAGNITVFNRSHYEDVLVPVVNGTIDKTSVKQRYTQINDFERMLTETGTTVLKFMLHISKDEQRQRLQDRIDDPAKHWKFEAGDLAVRKQWDGYQKAYQSAIEATGTPWAPWIVVPADSKTHRNLMIALVLKDAMTKLKLRYPQGDAELKGLRVV